MRSVCKDVFTAQKVSTLQYPLVIDGEYWKVGFSACVVVTDHRESLGKNSGS